MKTLLRSWLLLLSLSSCEQAQDLGWSTVESCRPSQTRCGDRCADTRSDPEHCGGCGKACAAQSLCQSGACVSRCSDPATACGRACVTLYQDDLHCGSCQKTCASSEHCDNATCLPCPSGGCR